MAGADLAVGAGGTTVWERCVLGLPSLVIPLQKIRENLFPIWLNLVVYCSLDARKKFQLILLIMRLKLRFNPQWLLI